MKADDILYLLRILEDGGVTCCLVGEMALVYYNVSRVIHDLEICVSEANLLFAPKIFASNHKLLELAAAEEYNIYTEYRRGFPRFCYQRGRPFHVALFSDTFLNLAPIEKVIMTFQEHRKDAEYSHEITDLVPANSIASLPMPRLAPFFEGICRKFCATADDLSGIAAEQLVDGMDLDKYWCINHISPELHKELNFALQLASGKISRLSEFSTNTVTCYIASKAEAERLHKVPGRNWSTTNGKAIE